jgi:hypothetical protein
MQLLTHEIIAFYFWILNLNYINFVALETIGEKALWSLPWISRLMIIAVLFLIWIWFNLKVRYTFLTTDILLSRFCYTESTYLCVALQIRRCEHRQMTRLWLTKDRPGLSSETAPQRDKTTNSRPKHLKRKQYLVKRPQSGLDAKTYWLMTVSRKVTLTLKRCDVLEWWCGKYWNDQRSLSKHFLRAIWRPLNRF